MSRLKQWLKCFVWDCDGEVKELTTFRAYPQAAVMRCRHCGRHWLRVWGYGS